MLSTSLLIGAAAGHYRLDVLFDAIQTPLHTFDMITYSLTLPMQVCTSARIHSGTSDVCTPTAHYLVVSCSFALRDYKYEVSGHWD